MFSHQELRDYLESHGCVQVSDKYWEKWDRLIFKKDDHTFPVQYMERYGFPMVVKICESIGIPAPADHQRNFDQLQALRMRQLTERLEKKANEKKNEG